MTWDTRFPPPRAPSYWKPHNRDCHHSHYHAERELILPKPPSGTQWWPPRWHERQDYGTTGK
jgi:hypothetical protein